MTVMVIRRMLLTGDPGGQTQLAEAVGPSCHWRPSLYVQIAAREYGRLPLLTIAERPEVHDQFSVAAQFRANCRLEFTGLPGPVVPQLR